MKRSSIAVCLVMASCFVGLAGAALGAQDQTTQATTGTMPSQLSSLANLEKRLQDVEGELAAARKQMKTALTVEARRALLERMEHLEDELQSIRRDLNSEKAQRLHNATTEMSAILGCCKVRDTGTQRGRTQMGGTSCTVSRLNADARSTSGARPGTQACFASGRIIKSQTLKELDLRLANDQGQLIRGQNSFCIEFSRVRDGNMVDPGDVQAEATMQMGRVKGMRAAVRLTHIDVGRYCAHVDFPLAGSWFITVKHNGASGKGKAVFVATIN